MRCFLSLPKAALVPHHLCHQHIPHSLSWEPPKGNQRRRNRFLQSTIDTSFSYGCLPVNTMRQSQLRPCSLWYVVFMSHCKFSAFSLPLPSPWTTVGSVSWTPCPCSRMQRGTQPRPGPPSRALSLLCFQYTQARTPLLCYTCVSASEGTQCVLCRKLPPAPPTLQWGSALPLTAFLVPVLHMVGASCTDGFSIIRNFFF